MEFPDPAGARRDDDVGALVIERVHASLDLPRDRTESLLLHVIREEQAELLQLTLVLAGHDIVLDLNQRFLKHDYVTDVLAFDYADQDGVVEGEIYVDLDTASERCAEFDTDFEREALRYVVHGLLHLLGYSDKTPSGKARMRDLEDRYLAAAS